jgi:AcrR family transcriptional regulator
MARRSRGQETRERIMAVALREFAARGYSAVTMEEIAAQAGVTKGAVYYWFTDKDDLGRELQHELYERLSNVALRALDPDGDIVSNILRSFESYLDALGDLDEARFFLRDAWVIPALDEGGRRDHEDAVATVREILARAAERGEIVALDPDALAHILTGAWAEATLYVLRTGERSATIAVVEHIVEALRPAIPPTKRRTGSSKPAARR